MISMIKKGTNEVIEVPHEKVKEYFTSGEYGFKPGSEIPFIDRDGQVLNLNPVDPKEVSQFLSDPELRIEGSEESAKRIQHEKFGEGTTNELLAGAAGAARSATLGLSDQALTKTGIVKPESLKGLEEENPKSTLTGELLGVLAPTPLSGPSLLTKAGSKISKAALPGAEKLISQKILSKGLANGVGSAVEGAAYGVGKTISEDALGDPDAIGEKLLSNVGYSALLGGGLGSALKVGEIAIPKALDKAKEGLNKILGDTSDGPGALSKAYAKASSFVSGKSEGDILEGLKNREMSLINPEQRAANAKQLSTNLIEHTDQIRNLNKKSFSDIRPEETKLALQSVPIDVAQQEASNTILKLDEAIRQMDAQPSFYPRMIRDKVDLIKGDFEKSVQSVKSADEVFSAIDDVKGQLDKKIKFGKIPGPEYQDSIQLLKGIRGDIKNSLENEAVWGVGGSRQAAFNDAFSSFRAAETEFNKAFGQKMVSKSGSVIHKISPSKVENFIKQSGTVRADLKNEILNDYLVASKNLIDETEKSYAALPGKSFDKKYAEALLARSADIAKRAATEAEYGKLLGGISAGAHNAPLFEGGALGAAAFGHPVAAAAIESFNLLKAPGLAIQRLAKIERFAKRTADTISKNAKGIFTNVIGGAQKVAPFIGSKFNQNETEKVINELNQINNSPDSMLEKLESSTKELHSVAPNVAGAVQMASVRSIQFLSSKAPKDPNQSPLTPKYVYSPSEIYKFNRYYSSVQNPTGILIHVKNGTLLPEHMEAVQTVYPKLMHDMQLQVMNDLTEFMGKGKSLPYKNKMSLSLFLGQDLDDSLEQQRIAMNQMSNFGTERNSDDQLMKPTQSGFKGFDNSNRYETHSQKIAEGEDIA